MSAEHSFNQVLDQACASARKLIPRHGTRFDVQDLSGIALEFKQNANGQVQEDVVYTPDSTLAIPKKK